MNDATFFRLEVVGEIAVITFDSPAGEINIISKAALVELAGLMEKINATDAIKAAVLISAKPKTFIAGADIRELANVKSDSDAKDMISKAQAFFNSIEASKKPYIAAIHGACFGGGLELALACHYRIGTKDPKTLLALPEVTLGILPAAGGTQRLPRLIGLSSSLELMLSGKQIHSTTAHSMRLFDHLVAQPEELLQSALAFARHAINKPPRKLKALSRWSLIPLWFAALAVKRRSFGLFPAPLAIIDATRVGILHGMAAGSRCEQEQFSKLIKTSVSKNLMKLFFSKRARQKNPFPKTATPIERIGVIGSGLMGSGIAYVSLLHDFHVHLSDSAQSALTHAQALIEKMLSKSVARNKISALEKNRLLSQLAVSTEPTHLSQCDAVIEAIFEDREVKRELLSNLEPHLKPECIFASNTSSIPISQIADKISMKDRVVGMHYFSPVDKMPLLEIIKTKDVSETTLSKAFEIGLRQGKTIILVNDSPGFYTTRIIAALFDEACILLLEGHPPHEIDDRIRRIGFPMGPIALMDEVGIDVGLHVSITLRKHFGTRLIAANLHLCEQMVAMNFLGRKTGKGFYTYDDHRVSLNKNVTRLLKSIEQSARSDIPIEDRLLLRMVNEAAFCLSEGIIESTEDGDIGAVFGVGFPAHRGGPFSYIHDTGKKTVSSDLDRLFSTLGERFVKAPYFSAS